MKFDFIIGNPPFQEEVENNGRKNPIYHKFMDEVYTLSDVVELISPARFLFDAGQTPKEWNKKMLSDKHLQVLYYEKESSKIFPNVEIKGGIAITLRNSKKEHSAIGTFTPYKELNSIIRKTYNINEKRQRLNSIIASQGLYRFSEKFFEENSGAKEVIGSGTGNKIVSSVIDKLPDIFLEQPDIPANYIKFLGRVNNKRVYKYIRRDYLIENDYIDKFNLFISEANNSGVYGEVLTEPTVGYPQEGAADTFLSAGKFLTEVEPKNLAKYMKTKFFRALLGIKKVTQHCPPAVWEMIPLQDFTINSDIDWSKSVKEIDLQLYNKYGLDEQEIDFIESHVKEME